MAGIMNALYPPRCRSCGQLFNPNGLIPDALIEAPNEARWIKRAFERIMRPWVCVPCRSEFVPIVSPKCTVCGVPFDGKGIDHLCGRCINKKPLFDQARSVGLYGGSMMGLVHRLKYQRRMELGRPLGRLLLTVWRRFWGAENYDLIIPVPLHPKKIRQRGFNQAAFMASQWYSSPSAHIVEQPLPPMATELLKRVKQTPSLTGLNRNERRVVIRGAFSVTDPKQIKKRKILLIDDVCTTGATANECAKALKKHNAQKVDLLTLARV